MSTWAGMWLSPFIFSWSSSKQLCLPWRVTWDLQLSVENMYVDLLFTPVAPIVQQWDHWCDLWIGNWIRLQRLLPLKRALTEVEHDVQDTHVAMDQVPFSYTLGISNYCLFVSDCEKSEKLLGTLIMVGTGFEQWWFATSTVSWEWWACIACGWELNPQRVRLLSTLGREIAFQICKCCKLQWLCR